MDAMAEGFEEYSWRGETTRFGATVPFLGKDLHIDLRRDRLLDQRILAARRFISRVPELEFTFKRFKDEEAARRPDLRERIEGFQIDLVAYHAANDPDVAEIYFTRESGGDEWFCVLRNSEFSDLHQEW